MTPRPPTPLVQAFVICRQIYESPQDGEVILVAPFSGCDLPIFPAGYRFSVYAHVTDARGRYDLSLRLVDDEDEVVWRWDSPRPMEHDDPLTPERITCHGMVAEFPRPGRYDLVLAANGEDLAHHALWARPAAEDDG